jgi:hypothetical protein
MKNRWLPVLAALVLLQSPLSGRAPAKERAVILTDIEADPDDTESLVRLMLYSNLIDIRGLIATTSCWKRTSVSPESIDKIVRAYGEVRPRLLKHEPGFPPAGELLARVKTGRSEYGMTGVGDGKDSPGSEWIVRTLDENDGRPLWVCVWGGANTLAQALFRIRADRPEAEARRLVSRLRVYTISDQDDSGPWIRANFPDLFYIVSPGDDYGHSTWGAINSVIDGIDNETISNAWLARNIQQGHGPLGAAYPDVAYGMEGDTPSWLPLIPNGLNEPERPDFGGWGGRYEFSRPDFVSPVTVGSGVPREPETRPIWTDASDRVVRYGPGAYGRAAQPDTAVFTGNKATLWRWRDDFQNDFAGRMDWCVKSFGGANHPPVPALSHPDRITVKSGEGFGLDAGGTVDPDGDHLSYLWFHYPEAGSYRKPIPVNSAENCRGVWIVAPKIDRTETAHFILRVTDHGTPPLSRYKRVIVTITPE